MPTKLKTAFNEDGTGVVSCEFFDENGESVLPNSITWALTDNEGTVINNREAENKTPGTAIDIVLTGDDLQPGTLFVTIWGTYDSDLGTDLPFKDWCSFKVRDALI